MMIAAVPSPSIIRLIISAAHLANLIAASNALLNRLRVYGRGVAGVSL
jgi:hypothetical protein